MPRKKKTKSRAKVRKGVWLIAAFKLVKCLILLTIALGALSLLHEDVAARVGISRMGFRYGMTAHVEVNYFLPRQ